DAVAVAEAGEAVERARGAGGARRRGVRRRRADGAAAAAVHRRRRVRLAPVAVEAVAVGVAGDARRVAHAVHAARRRERPGATHGATAAAVVDVAPKVGLTAVARDVVA